MLPDQRTALYLNALVGALGVDRLASGDLLGGFIKLLLFVLMMPLAVMWNLIDFVYLLVTDQFFIGPHKEWKPIKTSQLRAAKIGAGIVWFVLFALAVVATLLVSSAVYRPIRETSSRTSGGSGTALAEDEAIPVVLSSDERQKLQPAEAALAEPQLKTQVLLAEPLTTAEANMETRTETRTETNTDTETDEPVQVHRLRLPVPEDRHNDHRVELADPFSFENGEVQDEEKFKRDMELDEAMRAIQQNRVF